MGFQHETLFSRILGFLLSEIFLPISTSLNAFLQNSTAKLGDNGQFLLMDGRPSKHLDQLILSQGGNQQRHSDCLSFPGNFSLRCYTIPFSFCFKKMKLVVFCSQRDSWQMQLSDLISPSWAESIYSGIEPQWNLPHDSPGLPDYMVLSKVLPSLCLILYLQGEMFK